MHLCVLNCDGPFLRDWEVSFWMYSSFVLCSFEKSSSSVWWRARRMSRATASFLALAWSESSQRERVAFCASDRERWVRTWVCCWGWVGLWLVWVAGSSSAWGGGEIEGEAMRGMGEWASCNSEWHGVWWHMHMLVDQQSTFNKHCAFPLSSTTTSLPSPLLHTLILCYFVPCIVSGLHYVLSCHYHLLVDKPHTQSPTARRFKSPYIKHSKCFISSCSCLTLLPQRPHLPRILLWRKPPMRRTISCKRTFIKPSPLSQTGTLLKVASRGTDEARVCREWATRDKGLKRCKGLKSEVSN